LFFMPNLASLLKSEISRLSRREIRREVLPLRRSAAAHRREIAALKRTIAALERRAKSLAKFAAPRTADKASAPENQTRFVAKGLVSLRKRLGLSAVDLARLLGVSMQSVYNWEHKKATPRKEQVAAIVALRSLGKKEAQARLEGLKASAKKKTVGKVRRGRKNQSKKA
jgi:DNA-binding transcriptional regulator YiaG